MAKLMKRMFVHSEMTAAGQWPPVAKPDGLDEITLSLGYEEGGCKWEFSIELIRFNTKAAMLLKIYGDAWIALEEAPEIFKVLRSFQATCDQDDRLIWWNLIEALDAAGWKKVKPEIRKREEPVCCPTCGKV